MLTRCIVLKMILILDVETTGLPGKATSTVDALSGYRDLTRFDSARIVQMSMMLCDSSLNEVQFHDFVVKADGFHIHNSSFHGITNEMSQLHGVAFTDVARVLEGLLDCGVTDIVAHNAAFDLNVIKSELCRYGLDDIIHKLDGTHTVCTMKGTKNLVGAKMAGTRKALKFPSLGELYTFTFRKNIQNAHNSKYDVLNLHDILRTLHISETMPFHKIRGGKVVKRKPVSSGTTNRTKVRLM